jgi:hypothetical protein
VTDGLFTSRGALPALYGRLLRHATLSLRAEDVLTFLGRKHHGGFAGEIMNDWKRRWPAARVQHIPPLRELRVAYTHKNTVKDVVREFLERKTVALPAGIPIRFDEVKDPENAAIALGPSTEASPQTARGARPSVSKGVPAGAGTPFYSRQETLQRIDVVGVFPVFDDPTVDETPQAAEGHVELEVTPASTDMTHHGTEEIVGHNVFHVHFPAFASHAFVDQDGFFADA